MESQGMVVARFRQRFYEDPLRDDQFVLQGGGDMELKFHHDDPALCKKVSIHIPEEIGIEQLMALSHTDRIGFRNILARLSQETGENHINPLALIVQTHSGLAPLVTRISQRDTYKLDQDGSKATIDTGFSYGAYPYLQVTNPVFGAVVLEKQPDILHVEVKAPEKTDRITTLLKEMESLSIGSKVRPRKSFAQLRESALKKTGRIIKEHSDHEIEAKLKVDITNGKLTLDDVLMQLYISAASNRLPGFRLSPQFPDIAVRTSDSALYSTYGWVDKNNKVHEVLTVIRVEGNPPVFWMKRKGDPQSTSADKTMVRTEKMEILKEPPDMDAILVDETQKAGQAVIKIGSFRKRKIAFKVEEIKTGRMFTVSLDEDRLEGAQESEPLRQLEIEYAETPQENIAGIPSDRTIQHASNQLQLALSELNLNGVKLTPTSERKIEWLYTHFLSLTL